MKLVPWDFHVFMAGNPSETWMRGWGEIRTGEKDVGMIGTQAAAKTQEDVIWEEEMAGGWFCSVLGRRGSSAFVGFRTRVIKLLWQ